MIEPILRILSFTRAVFYLAVTVESVFLAYLYWNAYRNLKTTPIIRALVFLLLAIGINFFYLTIVALISFVGYIEIYKIMVALIPSTTVLLLLALRHFGDKSVENKKKQFKIKK